MKFCPKCNDRMSGEFCTTCDKDKLPERIKFSDYSNQKINSCDKGCGGKIYFDEDFKTEDGKFIPIDKNTGEKTSVQSAANGKLILKLFKKIRLCEAKIATDEKMINLFLN